MRAVICEDKDAKALLDKLKLESFEKSLGGYGIEANDVWGNTHPSVREEIIRRLHGRFHFVVCTWLQDQGFKVT